MDGTFSFKEPKGFAPRTNKFARMKLKPITYIYRMNPIGVVGTKNKRDSYTHKS